MNSDKSWSASTSQGQLGRRIITLKKGDQGMVVGSVQGRMEERENSPRGKGVGGDAGKDAHKTAGEGCEVW